MIDISHLRSLLDASTPGPWSAEQSWRLSGAVSAMLDGHSRQVASADGQAPQFDPRQRDTAEVMRANAALIAAAVNTLPELLAVVEAAFAWRTTPCSDLPFCERGDHELACKVMQREIELVAAIDAARSKENA